MEFLILGSLEVLDDGVPVKLGAPKQRAVLAVLLLHPNAVVSVDRLIEAVWGDDPPRTAEHSIQIYVSELRKAFDPDGGTLLTRRPGYELRIDPNRIDARRFEQLVDRAASAQDTGDWPVAGDSASEALALWRGSPLVDFAYEDFAQREIERLEELRCRALATLADSHIHSGKSLEAVPLLRDVTNDDPLGEEPRRLLMTALYAGGRQAEALREYRDFRRILADQTGLDPSPELMRLEERILLRDPSIGPPADEQEPAEPAKRNPYKGLRAFDEHDAADFFGRDKLVKLLVEACASPLTAIVGPSGSGKSSVVRAGLIPALRNGAFPGSENWTTVVMLPGRYPFAEFDSVIARNSAVPGPPCDPSDDAAIARAAIRCAAADDAVVLIVVDQFEELFTLTEEPTRRAFLRSLATAVDDPRQRIRVVLTLRADFYGRPLMYPEFAELFAANVVNLVPLTPAGLEAAAVEPARGIGVGFAPELLAQLVSDMADQPAALPLFQYTLTELFGEREGSVMSLEAYERIGGLSGALSRRADAVYDAMSPEGQKVVREMFMRLVRPTEDRYARRPVPVLELEELGDVSFVSRALTLFGDERLLTFDRDSRTGAATVEVSHEALLEAWDRLAGWLETAQRDLIELDALTALATEWEAVEREPGYLLADARLAHYEAWSDSTTVPVPEHVAAYLVESIDARRRAEQAESERMAREAKTAQMARDRLRGMLTSTAGRANDRFVTLTTISDRPPAVVFLFNGPGDGAWNDYLLDSVERAAEDFGLDIGVKSTPENKVGRNLAAVAEGGPELVLDALSFADVTEVREVMAAHPRIHFVLPDVGLFLTAAEIEAAPNVSYPVFPVGDGSFLVGVVAARMTETGIVGFIGGVDVVLIRQFEVGFRTGVEYVAALEDADIKVLRGYLTPGWDFGGFNIPSLGMEKAFEMHAAGADVIFSAAGSSGIGARRAAVTTTRETGIHRWHIGVDLDEYVHVERDPGLQNELPHVLTSMRKMNDVALYDAVADFQRGVFVPGRREYGLAEGGVGYATSGGHIEHLVPELEDLQARIIAGEIVVPRLPMDDDRWPDTTAD